MSYEMCELVVQCWDIEMVQGLIDRIAIASSTFSFQGSRLDNPFHTWLRSMDIATRIFRAGLCNVDTETDTDARGG
jgi:hypothetical protein